MTKNKTNPQVDFYFNKPGRWQEEIKLLRTIIHECGLEENLKWGVPCYSLEKSNIVLVHVFKEYCAILFFKGVLLKDTDGILVQQTKNVQSARQVRFTSIHEIAEMKPIIKAYISEAIEVEKEGLKVKFKKTTEYPVPEEFRIRLDKSPALKKAFFQLTPGRQRGYLLYFSQAKQYKTRESRIEKYMEQILNGKGLDD
jgi:uncharacterized protein YdeI (YjbR/CyaY-like superfamily)